MWKMTLDGRLVRIDPGAAASQLSDPRAAEEK